jgi:sec-independent protein translocase protein TatB
MFDISWSELLILGVVTLIFVGPKELPKFMATLGRYAGIVRRHAQDFRRHFDEAMREAELADIKKEVEELRSGVETSLRDAGHSATAQIDSVKREMEPITVADERQSVARAAEALDAPPTSPPDQPAPEPALVPEPVPADKPGSSS